MLDRGQGRGAAARGRENDSKRRSRGGDGEGRVKQAKPLFGDGIVVPFVGEKQVNVSPTVAAQAYI